jgi:endonuclease/exonuclease/phosphatase family metal-dependent hydrolase
MKKLIIISFLILTITLIADTNFRVMSYNALNFDETSTDRTSHFKDIIEYDDPDIIVMQEIIDQSGASLLLNTFNQINNEYSASSFINGFDTDNMLYFKSAIFTFVSQSQISTALRDINEYVLSVDNNELRIYSCHLKASDGSTNEQKRLLEVLELRDHLDTLPAGTEYLIVGDMNFYSSSEPAYQNLAVTTPLISEDLCTEVGYWHNSSSYSSVHTQSTRVESFGGGATGGLDDKFDFIFGNYGINNGSGIEFSTSSFTSYGNDGNHFNQSINDGTNSVVSEAVADALHSASDHLPVCADFVSIGGGGQPSGYLFISEYIEGNSYNKAIEIYNGSGVAINLASYSLEKDSAGNGEWGNTYNFTGVLTQGDVFVLANSQADPVILNVTDVTNNGVINFNGDDQVRLLKNSLEIDRIGIPGDIAFGENVTYVRKSTVTFPQSGPQDPRSNGEWDNYPSDTFSFLGSHTSINPTITITSPNGGENWERNSFQPITWISSDIGQNVKIELYKDAEEVYTTLIESTGNDGEWDWQIPADFTFALDYKIKISDAEEPTFFDESDDFFQVSGCCLISEIQTTIDGLEGDSPLAGQNVSTFGIVTSTSTYGYFLQNGSGPWNGIFVYDTINNTALGDSLHITGLVFEYNSKTEIKDITEFSVENTGAELPVADIITCLSANHEKYEGVLIKVLDSNCTNIDLGYGEWLVNDGTGDLVIDDLIYSYYPTLNEDYNIIGIIDYSYSEYKLEPRFASNIEIIVIQPEQPENVIIEILTASDEVKLTWQNEGYTYKIYSNDDPTIGFPDESWNLETTVQNSGEATISISGNKKFYIVVAEN